MSVAALTTTQFKQHKHMTNCDYTLVLWLACPVITQPCTSYATLACQMPPRIITFFPQLCWTRSRPDIALSITVQQLGGMRDTAPESNPASQREDCVGVTNMQFLLRIIWTSSSKPTFDGNHCQTHLRAIRLTCGAFAVRSFSQTTGCISSVVASEPNAIMELVLGQRPVGALWPFAHVFVEIAWDALACVFLDHHEKTTC